MVERVPVVDMAIGSCIVDYIVDIEMRQDY